MSTNQALRLISHCLEIVSDAYARLNLLQDVAADQFVDCCHGLQTCSIQPNKTISGCSFQRLDSAADICIHELNKQCSANQINIADPTLFS